MNQCKNIKFGGKAKYEIIVVGKLDPTLSERLGGMIIESKVISEEPVVSILTGLIPDQAALAGILNTIYEMHLPVISDKCIGINDA